MYFAGALGAPHDEATSTHARTHARNIGHAKVYVSADGEAAFVKTFAQAMGKVMHLDRFDLHA